METLRTLETVGKQKLALLGMGTVGSAVAAMIDQSTLAELTHVFRRANKVLDARDTSDFSTILHDASVMTVIETLGGDQPAKDFLVQALKSGKNVVTSNKTVVARNFDLLVRAANEGGSRLFIEATCGGAVPWINALMRARRLEPISQFSGVMNGTTNFMIEQMRTNGCSFDSALRQAQERGYAEADPTADIDGIDTAAKVVISARVAFRARTPTVFPRSGIRALTREDVDMLASYGLVPRLVGTGVTDGQRFAVAVELSAVGAESPFATLPDNLNTLVLVQPHSGMLAFTGQGAGGKPTASAVMHDVLDAALGESSEYEVNEHLRYDPSLLIGDYVFRSPQAPGGYEVERDMSAEDALRHAFERSEGGLPAFISAIPKGALGDLPGRC
ncbi:MAG: homoserine dehydrogenase [Actinomycetaceae bacterium]|nr:homoserine dehydrogenase [Actinomycetaceae bacterium]MDY6083277.1 homoserine dehydrogenase [Actinomycetaceae bacterium]